MSSVRTVPRSPPSRAHPRPPRRLGPGDRLFLTLIVGIPLLALLVFVWLPALASIGLSFTSWDGLTLSDIRWVGLDNYHEILTNYPPFWPAVRNNVVWLLFTALLPTRSGSSWPTNWTTRSASPASTRPRSSCRWCCPSPSSASSGRSSTIPTPVCSTGVIGHHVDWLGDPHLNLWAVLVASGWRHTGYIMILYLAGLKGFDPALKEAASLDGANGRQTFLKVVMPALKPVNIIVLVVTAMESLRAFDVVYVLGGGTGSKPGMELLSLLITDNIIGESSHIGYGSALAVILLIVSLAAIAAFLFQTFRKEDQ